MAGAPGGPSSSAENMSDGQRWNAILAKPGIRRGVTAKLHGPSNEKLLMRHSLNDRRFDQTDTKRDRQTYSLGQRQTGRQTDTRTHSLQTDCRQ